MKIFYKTSATAIGGRDVHTQVDDGSIGGRMGWVKNLFMVWLNSA